MTSTTGQTVDPQGVDHPSHYNNHPSGVECIEIKRYLPSNIADAMKYQWRSDLKEETPLRDLRKALWYIDDQLKYEQEMLGLYQPCCAPAEVLAKLERVIATEEGNESRVAFYKGLRDYFGRFRMLGLEAMRSALLHLIAERD